MKIGIVTDSTADLEKAYALRENVIIVPSQIVFNLQHYTDDGVSITVPQILRGMTGGSGTISTSPPAPHEYANAYRELLDKVDHIISLHTSEQIAQNIVHARQAASAYNTLVTVVDSRTITAGQSFQIQRLLQGIEQGKTLPQLLSDQRRVAHHGLLSFVVDDLRFLQMNGRMSAAAAFVGNMLNVKPILSIKEGRIQPTARPLGHRRALSTLVDSVRQYRNIYGDINLGFAYTIGGEAAIHELRDALSGTPFRDMGNIPLGAAIAANSGPGTVGIVLEPS